jgi:hypothetical protein
MSKMIFSDSSIIALAKTSIALTVTFFVVSLCLYIWRSRTFPIAQRFPVLVVIEATSLAFLGLQNLLNIAFPFDRTISDCQVFLGTFAIGELIAMVAFIMRIVLVIGKDLRARELVKSEWRNGVPDAELRGVRNTGDALFCKVAKFLTDFQVACIILLPGLCVSIVICDVAFTTGGLQDTLVSEEVCFTLAGYRILLLQGGLFVYLGIWLSLGFFLIFRLQDNFSIGLEIRIFCLTLSIMVGLTMSFCFGYTVYKALVVDSRAYGFIVGGFVIPVTQCAQFAFPVLLSFQNERKLRAGNQTNQSCSDEAKAKRFFTFQELSDSLDHLLNDPKGREVLISFLQSEFSVENLFFIESCIQFQKLFNSVNQDKTKLLNQVKMIYDMFLSEKAISPVNISHKVKTPLLSTCSSIINRSQEIESNLFEEAVKEVRKMLVMDSFQRFRISKDFLSFKSKSSQKDVSLV